MNYQEVILGKPKKALILIALILIALFLIILNFFQNYSDMFIKALVEF